MGILWASAVGVVYWGLTGYGRGGWVAAGLVVSHWLLDFITHRPDLPLFPGGPRVGLGLWNSLPATALVEAAIFLGGLWLYTRSTRGVGRGRYKLALFAVFIALVQLGNYLGPPPPDMKAVAILGLSQFVLVGWAHWLDRGPSRAA